MSLIEQPTTTPDANGAAVERLQLFGRTSLDLAVLGWTRDSDGNKI